MAEPRIGYQGLRLKQPRFEGRKNENIRHFISRFEKYATHQQVEQENYTDCLGLFLEGQALEVYDYTRRQNEEIEYEDLKAALIDRFDEEQFSLLIRNRLYSRKLKPSEKISDYYNDLLSLSAKIELSENDFLYIFINGLTSQIREHVICKCPTTLAEAVKIAKTLEQVKSWESTQAGSKSVYDTIKENIEKDKAAANSLNSERKEMQELKENINQIRQSIEEIQDSRWGHENQCYDQFYDEKPWTQDGYRQFESRTAYTPWYTFGSSTRPFKYRDYKQNRYQSNRYAFSNHFQPNNTRQYRQNQSDTWKRGNQSTYHRNDRRNGHNQESNGAGAQTKNTAREKTKQEADAPANNTVMSSVAETENLFGDMIIEAMIGGIKVQCLLDTGSQLDIIDNKVLQKLERQPEFLESEYVKVVAVNTSETPILGAIQESIRIGNIEKKTKFHVLPNSNHDIILGRKFIYDNMKSIDFETGKIIFKETEGGVTRAKISSTNGRESSKIRTASAKVGKRIKLKPGQVTEVKIFPSNDILCEKLIFQGNDFLTKLELSAERQIVPGTTSYMTVKVKNDSQNEKTLFPNRKIGLLSIAISEDMTVSDSAKNAKINPSAKETNVKSECSIADNRKRTKQICVTRKLVVEQSDKKIPFQWKRKRIFRKEVKARQNRDTPTEIVLERERHRSLALEQIKEYFVQERMRDTHSNSGEK